MPKHAIDWQDIPKAINKGHYNVKAAAANMLNDIAFDSRDDIVSQAVGELDFRGVAKNALGFKVRRKPGAKPDSLEQWVETNRNWLEYHLHDSNRKNAVGYRHANNDYLFIPYKKLELTTKRGRLTARAKRMLDGAYFIKDSGRDRLFVYFRKKAGKRTRSISIFLGTLVPQARYSRTIKPEQVIQDNMTRKANRLFNGYLDGRYKGKYKQKVR